MVKIIVFFQDAEYGSIKNEILAAVTETNEHLSELKNLYRAFLHEQKESPQQKQHLKKNDIVYIYFFFPTYFIL